MRVSLKPGRGAATEVPDESSTWTSDSPVPSVCVLKTVKAKEMVKHCLVIDVDSGRRKAELAVLTKVTGDGLDEPSVWKVSDLTLDKKWDALLDRIDDVKEEGRGKRRKLYFQTAPPILKVD